MPLIMMQAGTVTPKHASADLQVADGRTRTPRPYWLFVTPTYVTVIAGQRTHRTIGRTFHTDADLLAHYKRDGATLGEVVTQLRGMVADCA